MGANTRFDTRVVGALPVVSAMLEQWGLAGVVDAASLNCPASNGESSNCWISPRVP